MRQNPVSSSASFVSKTSYLAGLQCRKLLWTLRNAPHLIPAPDAQVLANFDQGKKVGDLAKQLFSDGIEIDNGVDVDNFERVVVESQEALKLRRPLYEAAFVYNGGLARADILVPVGDDKWNLIEGKSTTSVEDIHLHDLAFQLFVLTGAGLKIQRCILAHVSPDFVKNGPIDPHEFFVLADVTDHVSALSTSIEANLNEMFSTIRLPQAPEMQIGQHCDRPYACPLRDRCWNHLPNGSVVELYRGGAKRFRLLENGITRLTDIPENVPLTDNQRIQRQTAITGQPHVDKAAIKAFLDRLQYPVSFLDFETIGVAVPLFDGVRPYEQVVFQYSLHIVRSPVAEQEHQKFLAEGTNDPRPEFMRRLRDALPTEGSVIAFNAGFELGRLNECSDMMPEFLPWVCGVKRRIVDLLAPFRKFVFYSPQQEGSCSMKQVLPALIGVDYSHLEIQDGSAASREFFRVTFGSVSAEERTAIRRQLDEYCGLDTIGMVWIIDAMRRLAQLSTGYRVVH